MALSTARAMKTEDSINEYVIIGSGHQDCFRSALSYCWKKGSFTNVTLYGRTSQYGKSNQIRANASVLAAASPVLAKILHNISETEEDAVIVLPDYSQTVIYFALQYIYTGWVSLKGAGAQIDEIQCLLKQLGIKTQKGLKIDAERKLLLLKNRKEAKVKAKKVKSQDSLALKPSGLPNPAEKVIQQQSSTTTEKRNEKVVSKPNRNPENRKSSQQTSKQHLERAEPRDSLSVVKKKIELSESREVREPCYTTTETASNPAKVQASNLTKVQTPAVRQTREPKPRQLPCDDRIDCEVTNPEDLTLPSVLLSEEDEDLIPCVPEKTLFRPSSFPRASHTLMGFLYLHCFDQQQRGKPRLAAIYYEPSTTFTYDPAPVFLRDGPAKQYQRGKRKLVSSATEFKKPAKVHVSLPGDPVFSLQADSVFTDADKTLEQNETNTVDPSVVAERPKLPLEPIEKLLEDYEAAQGMLSKEKEKHEALRKSATRLTNQVKKLRRYLDKATNKNVAKKKKKYKPKVDSGVRVCCEVCGKLVRKQQMAYHQKTHLSPQFCCEKCGRTFITNARLQSHHRLQHTDVTAESGGFPCTECGRVFKLRQYLKIHMTLHTGEKPYQCKYCDQRFRREQVCRNHERTHTGEKPRECHICGKKFNQRGTLVSHLKTHEKNKTKTGVNAKGRPCFQCDQCPAQFVNEASLFAHSRAKHNTQTPLVCVHCSQAFTTLKELRNHRREIHGLDLLSCNLCEEVFVTRVTYYSHMRKHKAGKIKTSATRNM